MTLSATLDGESSPRPQGRLVRMDLQWLIGRWQAQLPFQDGRREVPYATPQGVIWLHEKTEDSEATTSKMATMFLHDLMPPLPGRD